MKTKIFGIFNCFQIQMHMRMEGFIGLNLFANIYEQVQKVNTTLLFKMRIPTWCRNDAECRQVMSRAA